MRPGAKGYSEAMLERIAEPLLRLTTLPALRKAERRVGYRLVFRDIPRRFVDGMVAGDMRRPWRRAGIDVEAGAAYWTIGRVTGGRSATFDRDAPEYQAWLGGYVVRFPAGTLYRAEDQMRLAMAAQDGWLRTYGDPHPRTEVVGMRALGAIRNSGYAGTLYEGDFATHSDVGDGRRSARAIVHPYVIAAAYNVSNPALGIRAGNVLVPRSSDRPYEALTARSLIALYDLGGNAYAILQGTGAVVARESGSEDRFAVIRDDLARALRACEIAKA